jgi:hypothetical protein
MARLTGSRTIRSLLAVAAGILFAANVHAGPQVTIYLTVPLGHTSGSHVFGLRLDRAAAPAGVQNMNPDSPFNRRALADLQLGADSALRLELDRRLTWDINKMQWRASSRPASVTLRFPVRIANPVTDQSRKPAVKALAIEP